MKNALRYELTALVFALVFAGLFSVDFSQPITGFTTHNTPAIITIPRVVIPGQTITVIGSNFDSGAKLQYQIGTNWYELSTIFVSASELRVIIRSDALGTYNVRVRSGNGLASTERQLTVTTLPVGSVGSADCNFIAGWTYDPNTPTASIYIRVYNDSPAGTGTFVDSQIADVFRNDVNAVYGISGNHGFRWQVRDSLKDGRQHSLYIYGVDSSNGQNSLLGSSVGMPIAGTCQPPPLTLSSISPNPVAAGQRIIISGSNFVSGAVLAYSGPASGTLSTNFVLSSQLTATVPSTTSAGSYTVKVRNPNGAESGTITLTVSATTTPTTYTASGFVFVDNNANGVFDTGDTKERGWQVRLLNTEGTTVLRPNTTDANGNYLFSGLAAGNYRVEVTIPSGYARTTDDSRPFSVPPNHVWNFGVRSTSTRPTATFTATPTTITSGQSATLSWTTTGATSVNITGIGAVAATGSRTVSPTQTTTYTLNASNSAGSITRSVTITVSAAAAPEITSVSPTSIARRQTLTITGLRLTNNVRFIDSNNVSYEPSGTINAERTQVNVDVPGSIAIGTARVLVYTSDGAVSNGRTITVIGGTSVSGVVFIDANNNMVQDSGESGFPGQTVLLRNRADTTTHRTAVTSSSGSYSISYTSTLADARVKYIPPSDYQCTTDCSKPIDVNRSTTVNFGVRNIGGLTATPSSITVAVRASATSTISGGAPPYHLELPVSIMAIADVSLSGSTLTVTGIAAGAISVVVRDSAPTPGALTIPITVTSVPPPPPGPSNNTYELQLRTGWNLISSPRLQSTPTLFAQFENNCNYQSPLYRYSNINNRYETATTVTDSKDGFWINVASDCSVSVQGEAYALSSYFSNFNLRRGWNLIGAFSESIPFANINGTCTFARGPYWYNPATNSWQTLTNMEPGKGYFVNAAGDCQLASGPGVPSLP